MAFLIKRLAVVFLPAGFLGAEAVFFGAAFLGVAFGASFWAAASFVSSIFSISFIIACLLFSSAFTAGAGFGEGAVVAEGFGGTSAGVACGLVAAVVSPSLDSLLNYPPRHGKTGLFIMLFNSC